MTPQRKLSIANVLMLLGVAPLVLGITWMIAAVAFARQFGAAMGGSDAFLMMAVFLLTYAMALVVAGPGALWSRRLVRRHADLRSRTATLLKWLVVVALGLPVLGYAGLTLAMLLLARTA